MTESILFIVIGITSFLSLIFLPRNSIAYLIGGILYGAIQGTCGGLGLYGSYKVNIKVILTYLIALVLISLFNLFAIVICIILFIKHLVDGIPHCSQSCDLTRFVFAVESIYYILQVIVASVLLVFAFFSFKHTLIFYKKEKKFLS